MNFNELFLIIVLYKTSLVDSETVKSLNENLDTQLNLFVFDNSPDRQYSKDNFVFNKLNIKYYHNGINHGLSAAYNVALEEASKLHKKWLLLLDQDTVFTKNYINEIIAVDFSRIPNSVAAIIPKVLSINNHNSISPSKMFVGGLCRPLEINSGISHKAITGINSGTIINIQFVKSLLGFNKAFPLDMLDHWYFREIYKSKRNVLVLNSIIFQNLSVAGELEETVDIERYEKKLIAEKMFVKEDGMLGMFIFKLRLLRRAIKQIKFKNKMYFHTSAIFLFKNKSSVFLNKKQFPK